MRSKSSLSAHAAPARATGRISHTPLLLRQGRQHLLGKIGPLTFVAPLNKRFGIDSPLFAHREVDSGQAFVYQPCSYCVPVNLEQFGNLAWGPTSAHGRHLVHGLLWDEGMVLTLSMIHPERWPCSWANDGSCACGGARQRQRPTN